MPFCKAANLSGLPPGSLMEARVGEQVLALCNVEGTVHALDGICPHVEGPLGHGALHGTTIVCPLHAWEFDCRTGEFVYNPAVRLRTFAVRLDGDDILVDLP